MSLPPSHGVAGVFVLDGATWVVASFTTIDDGTPLTGLLRVDPGTGAIERFLSLPGVDADTPVVAGGALWIPDETGHRIVRVDATELAG